MCRLRRTHFLAGILLSLALASFGFAQSTQDQQSGASKKAAVGKRTNNTSQLEMLTRAEARAEALRDRLLDLQMREADLQARLAYLDSQLSPENIERALVFVSSVRPRDELRDALRTRIENEKARVNRQLELVASSRQRLESALSDADAEVAVLRQRLNSR